MRDEGRDKRNAGHLWHVWINRRQDERRQQNLDWEHDLYEFKSMLEFLEYGHEVIARAYEGKLPKVHRQCSRQAPVEIKENILRCAAEGEDVTKCPILLYIKAVFDENKDRYDIPVEHLYRTMAKTCAWHTYTQFSQCDTSEGYLLDTSDRMFWDNVYQSMAATDEPTSGDATDGQRDPA